MNDFEDSGILSNDTDSSKENKWISVKDQLPEDGVDVLVYNPEDGISIGDYESSDVSGWYVQYAWATKMNPTHWMPIPSPPVM